MSTLMLDTRLAAQMRGAGFQTHPRGKGFRVLSRIARVQAREIDDYAPRHRRDVPVDLDLSSSIAD
jgi:hypothetical protein